VLLAWMPAGALAVSQQPSVLLVFAPAGEPLLASVPGTSVGMMSASQGHYSTDQLALDIGQGARIASSAYAQSSPSPLTLRPLGSTGLIEGWPAARRRAAAAPQVLSPGLLAAQIAGGAGYVGIRGSATPDAAVAADRGGRVAAVSLGASSTLLARVRALSGGHRLVVVDLPGGQQGRLDLRSLGAARDPTELLLVVQRSSDARRGALLWTAAAGLAGPEARELTSQSTEERGLIVSVDLAPTILTHLGQHNLPAEIRGKPIESDGRLDSAALRSLMARLRVVGERRLRALAWLLAAWALLLITAARLPQVRARAVRSGAIGMLWAPVTVLFTAALEPDAGIEYLTIALACLGLGALTDLLVPWPRAMLAPAIAAVVALTGDALVHTQLLMRSLLGPNPILGARFYGIGNELKSALGVLVLAAVAGALHPSARGRKAGSWMAAAGIVLAVVEGSARIGAGVGGVILVSAAFAVTVVMLAPGAVTRRRALTVLLSPIVALVALALIDLLTAHGGGHYTGSVLHASSPSELRDIIVRRYSAAWGELHNHAMPLATALALACSVFAARRREALLAPVGGDPAWLAALAGGLTAGVVGSLVEDSGPVLLVVAVFALGCVVSYLWSGEPLSSHNRGMRRESRSRARRQPAAPVR
jgi:hypothetical protein